MLPLGEVLAIILANSSHNSSGLVNRRCEWTLNGTDFIALASVKITMVSCHDFTLEGVDAVDKGLVGMIL